MYADLLRNAALSLTTPRAGKAREVSLQCCYDTSELLVASQWGREKEKHWGAFKGLKKLLPPEALNDEWGRPLDDHELCFIRTDDRGNMYIRGGPELYALTTEHHGYYIRDADNSILADPSQRDAQFLISQPNAITVDLGVGDGRKRSQRIRFDARARQKAVSANKKRKKENKTLLVVPEVPKVIVLVDINNETLNLACREVQSTLASLGLTHEILSGEHDNRPPVNGIRRSRKPDVTIICIADDFTRDGFFSPSGGLCQIVRQEAEARDMHKWHWLIEIFGGTFHNLKFDKTLKLIRDISRLFPQPDGPEESMGRDKFIVGLDYTTDKALLAGQYGNNWRFHLMAAAGLYRAFMRLGYKPFDLSKFKCTVQDVSCLQEVQQELSQLRQSQQESRGLEKKPKTRTRRPTRKNKKKPFITSNIDARAIRVMFRITARQVLKLRPSSRELDLPSISVRSIKTEDITRHSQTIWNLAFAAYGMRIGSWAWARSKQYKNERNQMPVCGIFSFTKRAGRDPTPPAPEG
ncbi:MAG: hypothetical protein AB7H77_04590 [Bdellovibrionales bacterium]